MSPERVLHHEIAILDALCARDVAALQALIAPDQVFVNGHVGAIDREALLAATAVVRMLEYTIGETRVVRIADDAWLVSYALDERGTHAGEPYSDRTYSTSVIVDGPDGLKVVHHHASHRS
jgi:ketosteroid isomerase-like protein